MTKRQAIWLIIRLAGLWFLFESVESTNTITSTYLHVSQEPALLDRSTAVFLQLGFQVVLYLVLGLYCVLKGEVFFYFLNRESDDGDDSGSGSTRRSTLGLP